MLSKWWEMDSVHPQCVCVCVCLARTAWLATSRLPSAVAEMTMRDLPVQLICECGEGARLVQEGGEPVMCMDFSLSVKLPILQLLKSLTTYNEPPEASKAMTGAKEVSWEEEFHGRQPSFEDYAGRHQWVPCPEISVCLEDDEGLQSLNFRPLPPPTSTELTHGNQADVWKASGDKSYFRRSDPEDQAMQEAHGPLSERDVGPGIQPPPKPGPDTCLPM